MDEAEKDIMDALFQLENATLIIYAGPAVQLFIFLLILIILIIIIAVYLYRKKKRKEKRPKLLPAPSS